MLAVSDSLALQTALAQLGQRKVILAPISRMNSSAGEHLYQTVRDNHYSLVVIELPGVQVGNNRRDRMRYAAISQLVRDAIRSHVVFLCYGRKGNIWQQPVILNLLNGCYPNVRHTAHHWCAYDVGKLDGQPSACVYYCETSPASFWHISSLLLTGQKKEIL